jgi:hypothetical protein
LSLLANLAALDLKQADGQHLKNNPDAGYPKYFKLTILSVTLRQRQRPETMLLSII